MLAVAVAYRAVLDLTWPSDITSHEATDAARFLLERLWRTNDLWGGLLQPFVSIAAVQRTASRWMDTRVRARLPGHLRARLS